MAARPPVSRRRAAQPSARIKFASSCDTRPRGNRAAEFRLVLPVPFFRVWVYDHIQVEVNEVDANGGPLVFSFEVDIPSFEATMLIPEAKVSVVISGEHDSNHVTSPFAVDEFPFSDRHSPLHISREVTNLVLRARCKE